MDAKKQIGDIIDRLVSQFSSEMTSLRSENAMLKQQLLRAQSRINQLEAELSRVGLPSPIRASTSDFETQVAPMQQRDQPDQPDEYDVPTQVVNCRNSEDDDLNPTQMAQTPPHRCSGQAQSNSLATPPSADRHMINDEQLQRDDMSDLGQTLVTSASGSDSDENHSESLLACAPVELVAKDTEGTKDPSLSSKRCLPTLEEFNRIPEPAGPNFAFVSVVRNRDERRNLAARSCPECEKYYECLPPELRAERIQRGSRHRANQPMARTPPHFWDVDLPPTPSPPKTQDIRPMKRRRRPLSLQKFNQEMRTKKDKFD
jgi:hypothetical protein